MYKKNKLKAKKLKKIYNNISKKMILIGITGTNGKTTVSTLLYKYMRYNGINATLIGSNGIYINDNYIESINTTPSIDIIYDVLYKSKEEDVSIVIMEVSSHAIKQYRVYGLDFDIKAITNITLDHLDFHSSIEDYTKTKLSFLKKGNVIINKDIKLKRLFKRNVMKYGVGNDNYNINNIKISKTESSFNLNYNYNSYLITTKLLGMFNCYNVLLFICILIKINLFDYYKITNFLTSDLKIIGRMNEFSINNKKVVVDYAHTPDGLEKVISFYKSCYKKVITVFGCGGDRDKTKRPLMGHIASRLSDLVIITTDNPRSEDRMSIIKEIKKGIVKDCLVEVDRKKAIDLGIKYLDQYDVLLILGRGNDSYYDLNGKKEMFNDLIYIKENYINE